MTGHDTQAERPELKNPVRQDPYRGRSLAITVRHRVYDMWVDGEHFETHVTREVLDADPAFDPFLPDNIGNAWRALLALVDNEHKLREQYPVGAQVTATRAGASQADKYAKGEVVGHRNRTVLIKIIETTYKPGSKHELSVVGNVVPMLPQHLREADPYPQHTRLKNVRAQTQAAGEFLEWLCGEGGYVLARWEGKPPFEQLLTAHVGPYDLLARWQGIDRDAFDAEKLAMIAHLREPDPAPEA